MTGVGRFDHVDLFDKYNNPTFSTMWTCLTNITRINFPRLWRHSPEECHQLGLVNKLYEMLRDPEPTVVTFSIQTLNIVLADEGGIVINNNMVKYFLPRISDYKEKELCFLLDFLAIKDMDDQLRLKLLNTFDPLLDRREGSVVLAVARLLTSVVEEQPSLRASLVRRISPIMISFLKTSHKEGGTGPIGLLGA